MVVSVVNLKGGVGKTTSVLFLGAVAARQGRRVVVLDGDNERSASAWAQAALDSGDPLAFEVRHVDADDVAVVAKQLAREGAVVVVDTPPNSREFLWAASSVADVVVVPTPPTGVDINRLGSTLRVLAGIDASRGENALNAMVLLVRYAGGRRLAREASEMLEERELPVMEATIRDLERYKQAFGASPAYLAEYEEVWDELEESIEE